MTDDAYKEVFYNLPKENGIGREKNKIELDIDSTCEIFELGDRSACIKCKKDNSSFADCNEKVLKVNPCNHRLVIVNHEDYISQFSGKKFAEGGSCDLLLFDTEKHKIAFCELGCYSEIYVETKKAKAQKQTKDSMSRFMQTPSGKDFVEQFAKKCLLFARRERMIVPSSGCLQPERAKEELNMQVFNTNPASTSSLVVSDWKVDNVETQFVIVNYPSLYRW